MNRCTRCNDPMDDARFGMCAACMATLDDVDGMPTDPIAELARDDAGFCPVCETGQLIPLGTLGSWTHFRCRDCGADTPVLSVSQP